MATRRKNLKSMQNSTKSNKMIQKGGANTADANELMNTLQINFGKSF